MNHFKEYCEITTLHGFAYLASEKRSKIEKFAWILMLTLSITCTILFLRQLVEKIDQYPIINYRIDVATKITQIPFPAVTYCSALLPPEKFRDHDYVQKRLNNQRLPEKQKNTSYAFNLWLLASPYNVADEKYSVPLERSDVFGLLNFISVENIRHGNWMLNYLVPLTKIFSKHGECLTFNLKTIYDWKSLQIVTWRYQSFRADAWDIGIDRDVDLPEGEGPYYSKHKNLGLDLHIFEGTRRFELMRHYYNYGFKVFIHSPNEHPDETFQFYTVSLNESYTFSITPQIRMIDDTLIDVSPEERNCFLPIEKVLKYSQTYTLRNCQRECLADLIVEQCDCIPFYLIHHNETRICELRERRCYEVAQDEFYALLHNNCSCLLPCESVDYDVEFSKSNFVSNASIDRNLFYMTGRLKAELSVRFKDSEFHPLSRRKHFTEIDILSFVGGLLGLFLGFSFLSFFELIYHFTFRICFFRLGENQRIENNRFPYHIKSVFLKLKSVFVNYMKNSSIHGLAYLADSKKHSMERTIWFIAFLSSMWCCVFLIFQLYYNFGINKITMVMSDSTYNVSTLPFPAVTFFGTFDDSKLLDYFDEKFEFSDPYLALTQDGSDLFVKYHLEHILTDDVDYATFVPAYKFMGYRRFIVPVLRNISRLSWFLKQEGRWNDFYRVPFVELLTTRGFGFSFNLMSASDIYRLDQIAQDFLYENSLFLNGGSKTLNLSYPWKAYFNSKESLSVTIPVDNDKKSKLYNAFFVHPPDEPPLFLYKSDAIEFDSGKMIEVFVTPNVITTDADLRSIDVEDRICFLDGEKQLRFFKDYTQKNCQMECFSNFSSQICGCVPFDVVRDFDSAVCELFDYACVAELEYQVKFEQDIEKAKSCNCLQLCNSVKYEFEFIESRFTNNESKDAILHFKFKDPVFAPFRRYRQFTFIDFLSYVGGLLGLFAGISVLSFFEIIYFFGPRLLSDVMKKFNQVHIN